jgi:hypothetical protein
MKYVNHQPSTINHQPSTINHQSSTIINEEYPNCRGAVRK